MPTSLPPYHDSLWGDFPPTIPDKVKPVIERLGILRTRYFDAREREGELRGRIATVEAEQIAKSAAELATGEAFTVDSEPVTKAREEHEQSIRDVTACQLALQTVERELDAAFKASQAEAKAKVDKQIESTRADYAKALESFESARKAHLDAIAAKNWTRDALKPLSEIGRRGGRSPAPHFAGAIGIDPRDTQRFKDEIDPPMLALSRPASDAGLAGPLDRVDVPSDGWE